jgi:hypothetical protein
MLERAKILKALENEPFWRALLYACESFLEI